MKESQVVIRVEHLSKAEREQILYNHIRLGSQKKEFKGVLKPLLSGVASNQRFSPEIARRLGNPVFTQHLRVTKSALDDFVSHPLELLCEIIRTLDDDSRSAIALVFMRGGTLPSPVEMTPEEQRAVALLGGSAGGVRAAMTALDGSLLIRSLLTGSYVWRFKHPTIRDAFATLVAEDTELMDVYLAGTPVGRLYGEVSCGDVGIEGVKVVIPSGRYNSLIERVHRFMTTNTLNKWASHRFLGHRCDKEFLVAYIGRYPEFISNLHVGPYLYAVSDVDVLVRLHKYGILPEDKRRQAVSSIRDLAVDIPDAGFLSDEIRGLLTSEELAEILDRVRTELLPDLYTQVDSWRQIFDGDRDPGDHFRELVSALQDYRREFAEDEEAIEQLDAALGQIEKVVEELRSELPPEPDSDDFYGGSLASEGEDASRSIFEDVDQ